MPNKNGCFAGWPVEQNGYFYRLTPDRQNWEQSREICQSYDGDLAHRAVSNPYSRMYDRTLFT